MTATATPLRSATKGAGRPPSTRATTRLADSMPLASVALTAVTAAATASMCRLFADWDFARSMIVCVVVVHLGAWLLRLTRLSGWIAVPLGVVLGSCALATTYYRDSVRGFVPSGETLSLFQGDIRLVITQFPTAVAPVPSTGSFAVATATVLVCVALIADAFAFRAGGRVEAIVPGAMVVTFVSAVGADRLRIPTTAAFVVCCIVCAAILRGEHGRRESGWIGKPPNPVIRLLPTAAITAAVAATVAVWIAPRLPGAYEEPLVDARNRTSVTQVLSPLVSVRSQLVNRSAVQMFVVSSDQPSYWRLSGLSEFDGETWSLATQDLDDTDGMLSAPQPGALITHQEIRIQQLSGSLVPAAYNPVQVVSGELQWAANTSTFVSDNDLNRGDTFVIESAIYEPSREQLLTATSNEAPPGSLDLPDNVPSEILDLAIAVTDGQRSTTLETALALQNWFQSEFVYDLNAQSGHSDDAMVNFLRSRRGYCEQFAATFATMARSLGVPTRVAVGFTPGELTADGYVVRGKNAHAWAEVWFDDYGWVLFEPTPGRGAPGAQDRTGLDARQDDETAVGGPGTSPTATTPRTPPRDIDDIPQANTTVPRDSPAPSADQTQSSGASRQRGTSTSATWLLPAIAVGLLAVWAIAVGPIRRWLGTRRRSSITTADRIVDAWHITVRHLGWAGAPAVAGSTPRQYGRAASAAVGIDDRGLDELARAVTTITYSNRPTDDATATRCELLAHTIQGQLRSRLPAWRRAWLAMSPRPTLQTDRGR
jgi:transglutaminase-like putative cysteine protease